MKNSSFSLYKTLIKSYSLNTKSNAILSNMIQKKLNFISNKSSMLFIKRNQINSLYKSSVNNNSINNLTINKQQQCYSYSTKTNTSETSKNKENLKRFFNVKTEKQIPIEMLVTSSLSKRILMGLFYLSLLLLVLYKIFSKKYNTLSHLNMPYLFTKGINDKLANYISSNLQSNADFNSLLLPENNEYCLLIDNVLDSIFESKHNQKLFISFLSNQISYSELKELIDNPTLLKSYFIKKIHIIDLNKYGSFYFSNGDLYITKMLLDGMNLNKSKLQLMISFELANYLLGMSVNRDINFVKIVKSSISNSYFKSLTSINSNQILTINYDILTGKTNNKTSLSINEKMSVLGILFLFYPENLLLTNFSLNFEAVKYGVLMALNSSDFNIIEGTEGIAIIKQKLDNYIVSDIIKTKDIAKSNLFDCYKEAIEEIKRM